MKRLTALILVLSLLLCGCGGDPNTETTTQTDPPETTVPATGDPHGEEHGDQNVTLTVWVTADNIWEDADAVEAMLEEFNAYYPNILVNVEYKNPGDLGSGRPDIVLGHAEDLAAWNEKGYLADLTNLWKNRGEDICAAARAVSGDGDSRFMMPMCMVIHCMAINREYFRNAQALSLFNAASHTWSADNFLQALRNLYDIGMEEALTIYCNDTSGDTNTRLLVSNFYGGSFVNTVNGTYTADSANLTRALTGLAAQKGIVFDGSCTAQQALDAFLAGDTAMVLNWSSALHLQYGQDANIFFMNYPAAGKTGTYAEVYGLGVLAGENATKVAASMTFVAHVSGSDAAARATGQIPARESAKNVYAGTELEDIMTDLNRLLTYTVAGEVPGQKWDSARAEWVAMLRSIASGTDPKTAAEDCQKKLDELLGK